jgi:hypothetical protein
MEIVGGPWKTYIGIGLELPWSLGYSILPGIAFLLKVSVAEKQSYICLVSQFNTNQPPVNNG